MVALGVASPLLAACGGSGSDDEAGSGGGDAASSQASGGALGPASEVPVGGGKVYADQKVVVTQPTQGDFKAFSAVCTHRGCVVAKVEGKDIDCNCHGSKFSIEDGSVVSGPATKPLATKTVTTDGGQLTVT